jgi:large subunit ribosomal protein LP0
MSLELTAGQKRKVRKGKYKTKFEKLIGEYKNVMVIGIDNVGSNQLQKIRTALRNKAVVIMGKNTLMRKLLRDNIANNPKLEKLVDFVVGNMGFVFTNGDLAPIRNVVTEFKVPAGAKSGTQAPSDVFVPAGPTGLDPGQTAFFQALNIGTKIAKGSIEIINEVHLIKKGEKVTSSAVALLNKLDIKPFFYGVNVLSIYEDGSVYPVEVLDITPDDILQKFLTGVSKLTALSLSIGWPSQLTIAHYFANAFRKMASISLATTYSFKQLDELGKKAASAPKQAAPAKKDGGDDKKKKAEEEKKKKDEEKKTDDAAADDEGDVGVGGLFD